MTLTGVFNIMATPFDEQGAIDVPSLRRLVDFQVEAGADGLPCVIEAVRGDNKKERERVLDEIVEVFEMAQKI